jgi:hypothetical protein
VEGRERVVGLAEGCERVVGLAEGCERLGMRVGRGSSSGRKEWESNE